MVRGTKARPFVAPYGGRDLDAAGELRRLRLVTGGPGMFFLCAPGRRIISTAAAHALIRAAYSLGFKPTWQGVTDALSRYQLPDVVSEAVEELEA